MESLALELRVVHLSEHIDELLEVVAALLEVLELEVTFADAHNDFEHIFLSFERTEGVDVVECVCWRITKSRSSDFQKISW